MRSLLPAVLTALTAVAVHANPARQECKQYNNLVQELKREKATPFCSSYLHLSCTTTTKTCTEPTTTTVTSTVTTTTVTITDPTSTVTSCIPASTTVTSPTADCANIPLTAVPIGLSNPECGGVQKRQKGRAPRGARLLSIPTPPALKGANKAKCSAACGCMDIPRTSTVTKYDYPVSTCTETTKVAATSYTTATTSVTATTTYATYTCACTDPAGWQYGFWDNPFTYVGGNANAQTEDPSYRNFDPTQFQTSEPYTSGTTTEQSGAYDASQGGGSTVYGSTVNNPSALAIVQRGYFKAPSTGTYSFNIELYADDIQLLWVGTTAYSGWERENADTFSTYYLETPRGPTADLVKGQYYPVRFVYGQVNGGAKWSFTASDADGNDVTAGNIVQYNCDPNTRPAIGGDPYNNFGMET